MAEKEYIDKETVLKHFDEVMNNEFCDADFKKAALGFSIYVSRLATADVVPIHHGHWIEEYDCGYTTPHCSECGETALTKEETSCDYVYSSYCPRCGAKMDKTE